MITIPYTTALTTYIAYGLLRPFERPLPQNLRLVLHQRPSTRLNGMFKSRGFNVMIWNLVSSVYQNVLHPDCEKPINQCS
ncbi:hypothetical protein Syun_012476 [Stephania yunnanensis]|uniref:Uncharacterized protein n=1 Tax=Stephania yunnanensis TaxID=152371 RepID=A0AAP0JZH5_9MAGN